MLVTNRREWTAVQVVQAYSGQQNVERVFRRLKGGHWLDWGLMVREKHTLSVFVSIAIRSLGVATSFL